MPKTTRSLVTQLHGALAEVYATQLDQFGTVLKKKTRDALLDGFKDGCASGIRHALKLVECEIAEGE
jgi:hypothetical protein